jgi:hypothetical protein
MVFMVKNEANYHFNSNCRLYRPLSCGFMAAWREWLSWRRVFNPRFALRSSRHDGVAPTICKPRLAWVSIQPQWFVVPALAGFLGLGFPPKGETTNV